MAALANVCEYVPTYCAHCEGALPLAASEHDPHPVRHQVTDVAPAVVETIEASPARAHLSGLSAPHLGPASP